MVVRCGRKDAMADKTGILLRQRFEFLGGRSGHRLIELGKRRNVVCRRPRAMGCPSADNRNGNCSRPSDNRRVVRTEPWNGGLLGRIARPRDAALVKKCAV